MKDHIPEQKYFREVNCLFKRFAVLPTDTVGQRRKC